MIRCDAMRCDRIRYNTLLKVYMLLFVSSLYQIILMYCHGLFNPLNAKLNPICHLLALLGAHHILHISRIRVKIV